MSFHLHRSYMQILLAAASLNTLCAAGASAPCFGGKVHPEHETILGIRLGVSNADDVTRTFGRAPHRESSEHEETTSCYVGRDRTIVEFSYWIAEPIEFRLFHSDDRSDLMCVLSPVVSKELATMSGLRLGLSEEEVVEILGSPIERGTSRFVYEITSERPPTAEEIRDFRTKGGPPWEVKTIQTYRKVEIIFENSKVASVSVLRTGSF